MSTPTTIRYAKLKGGFMTVTSYFENGAFCACVQRYEVYGNDTILAYSSPYGSESGAVANFEYLLQDTE